MGDQQVRGAETDLAAIGADRPVRHLSACWSFGTGELEESEQIDGPPHLGIEVSEHFSDRYDPMVGETLGDGIVKRSVARSSVASQLVERGPIPFMCVGLRVVQRRGVLGEELILQAIGADDFFYLDEGFANCPTVEAAEELSGKLLED